MAFQGMVQVEVSSAITRDAIGSAQGSSRQEYLLKIIKSLNRYVVIVAMSDFILAYADENGV